MLGCQYDWQSRTTVLGQERGAPPCSTGVVVYKLIQELSCGLQVGPNMPSASTLNEHYLNSNEKTGSLTRCQWKSKWWEERRKKCKQRSVYLMVTCLKTNTSNEGSLTYCWRPGTAGKAGRLYKQERKSQSLTGRVRTTMTKTTKHYKRRKGNSQAMI